MNADIQRIRALAKQWAQLANGNAMKEKIDAWTKLHDLRPVRPVCIIETELMSDFVTQTELKCEDPALRGVEQRLLHGIKHATLFDDDYVLNRAYKTDFVLRCENYDYGVGLTYRTLENHAVVANHPIEKPSDLRKLKKRTFSVDIEASRSQKNFLEDLFDGIIPVQLQLSDFNLPQISKYVFDLIGMENLYFWMIDEPNAIREIVGYIKDDYIEKMRALEKSGFLTLNNENQYAGSGSLGYISDIKRSADARVRLQDMWVWIESQETETISPDMFEEFFLPALKEIADLFRYTYYGCCEHLHDRFDRIEQYIRNIRCVSVSPWSDKKIMGKLLKNNYVFSAKLTPQFISQAIPDERSQDKELADIFDALQDKKLVEYIYRDVYEYRNDPEKFRRWIAKVKKLY